MYCRKDQDFFCGRRIILEGTLYKTKSEVLKRGQEVIGKPLKEVDKTGRLQTGKGAIGTVIEESWFGYSPNSESEPDFPEAGVELKVTPYIRKGDTLRAKERLVCNIIDYMKEYNKTFKTSAFWHKCNTMLLMSYEHRYDVPKGDYTIDKAILFSFPEEDLKIIEQDWMTIMAKVRAGQAHLISEGDTYYLAACTKGANAESTRQQPFSSIRAKQRAYSLKGSYMTRILNTYVFGKAQSESIIKDWHELEEHTFDQYIVEKLKPYFGMTQSQLKLHFGVESTAKNLGEILLGKMLDVKGKIAYTDEFQKADIIPKTIRVRKDGSIKESMSFPTFDFIKLSQENEWEESEFYEYLAPAKFAFIIFQEDDAGELVFSRVKFWNIPAEDLEEVGRVWMRTVETIRRGVRLEKTPSGVQNDLPKSSESSVAHVRPHGKDGNDKLPLPDGRMMTKQCFWLNNTYIAEQIKERGEKS